MAKSPSVPLVIATIPFENTDPYPGPPWPTKAIVREIDFAIREEEELWFYFSRWSKEVDVSAAGAFQKLIDRIVEGDYDFDYDTQAPLSIPYSSPLSLGTKEFRYIIFVLSDKKWQFCRKGYPITISKKAHEKYKYYFHGHRVFDSGPSGADMGAPFEDDQAPVDNCKILYFIAKADKAYSDSQAEKKYCHSINLHVDLIYQGMKQRYMPIVIDPDIRYPGGSSG